jgi:GNAT superfamily N-acetyltransferase
MLKTDELKITHAEISDMEEILNLQYSAYQSEALIHGDFTIQPLVQTLGESIAEYHESIVLKAVRNSKIIGSVRAYAKGDTAYIGKLMVYPAYQGGGLGKHLLTAIEQEFPHKRYELFTSGKSDRNLHLYETPRGLPQVAAHYRSCGRQNLLIITNFQAGYTATCGKPPVNCWRFYRSFFFFVVHFCFSFV